MSDVLEILQAAQSGGETEAKNSANLGNEEKANSLAVAVTVIDPSEVRVIARRQESLARQEAPPKEKRRQRGSGHLFVRGQSYWMEFNYEGHRIRESLKVPATGKKVDEKEAARRMDEAIRQIRNGEGHKKFEPLLMEDAFNTWIAEADRSTKKSTAADYRHRWAHLQPVFGKLFVHQITKDVISAYLTQRAAEGAGASSQNRENRVLQMILKYNESKISPYSRLTKKDFPKMLKEHTRTGRLSQADYEILKARLDSPKLFWLRVFLAMTFAQGFRKNELLLAKVGYFNAKEETFTLPAYSTKNGKSRVVDIPADGKIHAMLVELTKGRDADAALFTRNGRPVKDFRGEWAKQTAGMTGGSGIGGAITIHDLRRSAVTGLANKGITADQAGTHLTPELYSRYIQRNKTERQATARLAEADI